MNYSAKIGHGRFFGGFRLMLLIMVPAKQHCIDILRHFVLGFFQTPNPKYCTYAINSALTTLNLDIFFPSIIGTFGPVDF